MKDRILATVLVVCALFWGTAFTAHAATEVVFANYFSLTHPNTKAMTAFREKLERGSGGAFKVVLKPNNQAGGEEMLMELVKHGSVQVAMVGGLIQDDEPMLGVWEQPFLIENWAHARAVFFHPAIKHFEGNYTANTGVLIKGYAVNGFRQLSCNFPLNSLDGLRGMKLRTPLNAHFVEIFRTLGADPTPLPMTELYSALENRIVDGQDNPYSTVRLMEWWKVQPYILETRHIFSPTFVLVNQKFYDSLSDTMRQQFDRALSEAISLSWDLSMADEQSAREFLLSKGVRIVVADEAFRARMRAALQPYYARLDQELPAAREFRELCAALAEKTSR